jgi:hypothetical protein
VESLDPLLSHSLYPAPAQQDRAMIASRLLSCLAAAGVIAATGVALSTGATAEPAPTCLGHGQDTHSPQDINNDAASDVVVGVPSANVVDIHYGKYSTPTSQRIGPSYFAGIPAAGAQDDFGAAITTTDASAGANGSDRGDGCADLVIGAPGADGGRGAALIAFGSDVGIAPTGAIRITGRTAGERFGAAVASDRKDIWIAAPNRTVSGHRAAGAVDHYRVNTSGTAVTLVQTLTENTAGVPGLAEANDHFGQVLATAHYGPLVIGEPGENVGHQVNAGTVTIVRTDPVTGRLTHAAVVSQNTPGVTGHAEAGDRFGAAVSVDADDRPLDSYDVAVGVPGDLDGTTAGAGRVHVLQLLRSNEVRQLAALSQESPHVAGRSERGDHFGASVLFYPTAAGTVLAVGVPGEDVGTVPAAVG